MDVYMHILISMDVYTYLHTTRASVHTLAPSPPPHAHALYKTFSYIYECIYVSVYNPSIRGSGKASRDVFAYI